MAASIALITSKMCRNRGEQNCSAVPLTTTKNADMAEKNQRRELLNKIKPSGRREENFFELVYEVARQIPKGRVTSYGAIANCLGTKLSARMVGWAMNSAGKVKPKVPA